MYNINTFLFIN